MKQLEVGDLRWNLVDHGTGPAVLLVHGFPLDHSMWRRQWDALASRYRVIVPDLPGYGRTTVGGARTSTTMEEMADQLADLLDALEVPKVAFCGLSMGGYVGWQFWLRHRARLSHLVACDTRAIADTLEIARGRRILASGVAEHGTGRVAGFMTPKLFAPETREKAPDWVAQTAEVIGQTSPATIAMGHLAMSIRPDVSEHLEAMGGTPTLLVVGEHDEISTPAEMKGIAKQIPHSTFAEIAHAGHMAPLEQADAFNDVLLDFLSAHQA